MAMEKDENVEMVAGEVEKPLEVPETEVKSSDFQYKKEQTHQGISRNYMPIGRKAALMTDDIYVAERVQSQIDWHSRKSSFHQTQYKKWKRIEFMLAATIPVMITFSEMSFIQTGVLKALKLDVIFVVAAAVSGIFLAFSNKLLELEEYFKYWKDYRVIAEQMEQEKLLYLTRTEPYDEDNAFPLLVETIEDILNKNVQKWKQVPKHKDKEGDEKKAETPEENQQKEK